ncbi:hypothetical protein KR222_000437, partial [Zaprionus bogoriensis]
QLLEAANPHFQQIGKKYYYIDNAHTLNWQDAKKHCAKLGAKLASFENRGEFQTVTAKLTSSDYWINIHEGENSDDEESREFLTDSRTTYISWLDGEPNDRNSDREKCVELRKKEESGYGMNDEDCNIEHHFICK